MAEPGREVEPAPGALALVLPSGWQRVHVDRLFETLLDDLAGGDVEQVLGAEEARSAGEALAGLRGQFQSDGVIFTALRRREGSVFDVLTVALPGNGVGDDGEAEGIASDSREEERAAETVERVTLAEGAGISHRSGAPSDGEESPFRSRAQLVTIIPPAGPGAIVTLVSSEAEAQDLLEADAEAIAGSLRIDEPALPSGSD